MCGRDRGRGKEVVLAGGFDGYGPQADVWVTRDGKHFRVVARLPQPVRYPTVAAHGSDVYVFAACSQAASTAARSRTTSSASTCRQARHIVGHIPTRSPTQGADVAGQLLVIGAHTDNQRRRYRFNPATNAISRVATLPASLTDAAVATIGKSAYLLGGISAGRPLSTVVRVTAAG